MSAVSDPFPAEPWADDQSEGKKISLLEAYWDELRRGEAPDPQQWLSDRAEDQPELVERLRLLRLLDRASKQVPRESSPEPITAHIPSEKGFRLALPAGTRLSERLEILKALGAGGMGEVYVAWHHMLGQEVAVKVLPEPLTRHPQAEARFRREMLAQARLGVHEHIVRAMDAGEEQGRSYLVMEYVPGTDLGKCVTQERPLPWREACRYIRQAALGLGHAHARGVVHRDLKPANLLRTPDGQVKILDWGLARISGQESLTESGVGLGTEHYIAPELADDPARADARSDLYSLGSTFFHLLTGQPYMADTTQPNERAGGAGPVRETLRSLRPDVPRAVVAIVAKLLAERPEERYASARALLADLDAGARAVRKRVTVGVAVSVAALVLGSALGWRWWGPPAFIPSSPTVALRVRHFRHETKNGQQHSWNLGQIGDPSSVPYRNDLVVVEAEFGEAVYPYLIVIKPDGVCEERYPKAETSPPRKALTDPPGETGYLKLPQVGLVSFVLVAARKPLPPFAQWRPVIDVVAWKQAEVVVPWSYDGHRFEPLARVRVEEVEHRPPKPFADVCRHLKERLDVAAVRAIAFPVKPNSMPPGGGKP